ncbi:ribonuclease H-like domain-containing protein [Cohnella lubricantis]|uniref:Ribonuclease H-like domain-containing protein n=1 Tax=Cohnella lubricantis TaxID=2163172 RepID=A0A841T9V6_9BACL|nr:ribonuclease H-like domain-containing protein [Cohnella lubricantis]MBB6676198.1 ribonuclease H-like domain-containing protein [Cohnella lubricantis]MBP2118609.1 uncharacterized protein YprB with RNaseH-like and TPR domain [Cohnella lubricantis]
MSGGLRERLGRLRGQSSANKAEAASAGTGESLQEELREGAAGGIAASEDDSAGSADMAKAAVERLHPSFEKLGVSQIDNEHGSFLLRRCEYALDHRHGLYELGELLSRAGSLGPVAARQNKKAEATAGNVHMDREQQDEASEALLIEAERLLFLDTETTGLGVGAGNVPFMIGIGCFEPDSGSLIVEQMLIRHPGEEKAMLHYLLGRMNGRTHLVTYNGRSFDWPVLVTRFILNGWRRSGPEPGHLDFLHPSRALWRNTLESCRLSRIEEERLGIGRIDDVPGSLAPELYMRYLNDGDASQLEGVYLHNERDILTLVTLAAHFAGLLTGEVSGGPAPGLLPEGAEELYRTAAWLDAHGRTDLSEPFFLALSERTEPTAVRWWLLSALRYKRLGRLEEAVPLWERAAAKAEQSVFPSYEAHIELAMHFEHRVKDIATALHYAERAMALELRRTASLRETPRVREEREALRKRLDRLKRKAARR